MEVIGTNIISSLGFTTEENFTAVKQGISGIKHYETGTFDLPEAFMASLIDKEKLNSEFAKISSKNNYTDLEKAAILSVSTANSEAQIDLSNEKTLFILSTTKGNVELLDARQIDTRPLDTRQIDARPIDEESLVSCVSKSQVSNLKSQIPNLKSPISNLKSQIYLWHTAHLISDFFGNPNTPIVVSNACISGAAAQIVAMRALKMGNYDYAVVVGVDFLSKFIISGFQSFKALSPELCRPFDKERCGLNLGEAAATMIFGTSENRKSENRKSEIGKSEISLLCGAIRNDANHISAPSRTGEGSFRALKSILQNIPNPTSQTSNPESHYSLLTTQISFINAHGTSTPYNDAAEVNAIVRAELEHVPVNSLKAFFGHTLGAAGVVETIISMQALSEGIILPTLNFAENEQITINDKPYSVNIVKEIQKTDKRYFIKMLSGFGGCNAALLYKLHGNED